MKYLWTLAFLAVSVSNSSLARPAFDQADGNADQRISEEEFFGLVDDPSWHEGCALNSGNRAAEHEIDHIGPTAAGTGSIDEQVNSGNVPGTYRAADVNNDGYLDMKEWDTAAPLGCM